MGQETLYLKWRPKDFDDVVGQTHVTRTLHNACRSGRVAHAYLFAGPRGTGKTSIARILAKALNCLAEPEARPCNRCAVCQAINQGRFLDLIEIDGASNRGIDEMRELREKVNFRPNEGRYKVYIIDEVHMLTREAFNALLKTLEEPPEYVVFVFATTEVWRVPATIRSRTQRFDLHPIRLELIESRLRHICEAESIARDDRALSLIARQATGSLRDAISMLDQIASVGDGVLTADQVRSILGTAPDEAAEHLLAFALGRDLVPALELLSRIVAEGYDMRQFALDVLSLARAMLLLRLGVRPEADAPPETLARLAEVGQRHSPEALLQLTRVLGQAAEQVRTGNLPQLPLELALVEAANVLAGGQSSGREPAQTRGSGRGQTQGPERGQTGGPERGQTQGSAPTLAPPVGADASARPVLASPRQTAPPLATQPAQAALTLERLRRVWPKVGAKVQLRDRTLEPLLRTTEPARLEGSVVTVAFAYPFHRSVFESQLPREILEQALRDVTGQGLTMTSVVAAPGAGRQEVSIAESPAATDLPLEEDPLYKAAIEMGGKLKLVE